MEGRESEDSLIYNVHNMNFLSDTATDSKKSFTQFTVWGVHLKTLCSRLQMYTLVELDAMANFLPLRGLDLWHAIAQDH
jgi:hypothetical protein